MDLQRDPRIVMTLDAGGTNFVFSAIQGGVEVIEPIQRSSCAEVLSDCLSAITAGFEAVKARLAAPPVAISFAFPGPADYPNGVIGDLNNLPAFRGGVPLGPMLQAHFGIPAFINNDGNLFAYGEALAGLLPEVNAKLAAAGLSKRFKNLFGVTLGTGFGGGLVVDGRLFLGDNAAGAEIWCMRNKLDPGCPAEEGVSIRAVRSAYAEAAGLPLETAPDPKTIFHIAQGLAAGHRAAAREAFWRLGEVAGDTLANISAVVDSLVVVGGGLSGAASFILPPLVQEMNGTLKAKAGGTFPRLEVEAFNLEDPEHLARFVKGQEVQLPVPGTDRTATYDALKRIGVGITRLGTSRATSMGAYAFALQALDR